MKLIPLTQGKFAQVDDADFEWLSQWKWRFNGKYAIRTALVSGHGKDRIRKIVWMHREINNTPEGMETDHKYGNELNNQRYNLRDSTHSQNRMNQKKIRGSSRYKGVRWDKNRKKWAVKIGKNRKYINLGRFSSEEEAGRAYDVAAIKHHGEFARLNFADSLS